MNSSINLLLQKRTEKNKEKIDSQIWSMFGANLALAFVDLTAFTQTAKEKGIIELLHAIYQVNVIIDSISKKYDGTIIKYLGDGCLLTFKTSDKAIQFAQKMMTSVKKKDKSVSIAIGYGKIIKTENDIFGNEVNAVFKLEVITKPMEILATESLYNDCSLKASFQKKKDYYRSVGISK